MAEKFPVADSPGINTTLMPENAPEWLRSALHVTGEDVVETIGKRAQQDVLPSPKSAAVLMLWVAKASKTRRYCSRTARRTCARTLGKLLFPAAKLTRLMSTSSTLLCARRGKKLAWIAPLLHRWRTGVKPSCRCAATVLMRCLRTGTPPARWVWSTLKKPMMFCPPR